MPGIAPSNAYPCSDGDILIGGNGEAIFARLAKAVGQEGWTRDPRFATHRARGEHQAELDALIADWTRTRTVAEVEAAMLDAQVPVGRIYKAPTSWPTRTWRRGRGGPRSPSPLRRPAHAGRLSPLLRDPWRGAPPRPDTVGQHNFEVFCGDLGLTLEELEALRRRGVL